MMMVVMFVDADAGLQELFSQLFGDPGDRPKQLDGAQRQRGGETEQEPLH